MDLAQAAGDTKLLSTYISHIHLFASPSHSVKDTVNSVTEKVQETTSGASKEANKNVAKDSDASLSTRATAAKDAASDKMDESKHGAKQEGYEQKAKN